MTTMQAAIVEQFGHEMTVGDYDKPTPGPGQALVKLIASGVCHTDLHALEGDWPVKPKLPLVPGHEGALAYVAGAPVLENAHRFLVYTLLTSTGGWDTGRAITTGIAIAVLGPAVLTTLRRAARRAQLPSRGAARSGSRRGSCRCRPSVGVWRPVGSAGSSCRRTGATRP